MWVRDNRSAERRTGNPISKLWALNLFLVVKTASARALDEILVQILAVVSRPVPTWSNDMASYTYGSCVLMAVGVMFSASVSLALGCADIDTDGDVDLADCQRFQLCLGGAGGEPLPPECSLADFDGDGDIDDEDWWEFHTFLGGPDETMPVEPCYLARMMDRFHGVLDVYSDVDAAGNHFVARGRMPAEATDVLLPPMDEAQAEEVFRGTTAIRCEFRPGGADWGGWYFMNGVLRGDQITPVPNWGDESAAGYDLRGARTLILQAKGASGGERVEFFALGVGRSPGTGAPLPDVPYPGSAPKVSTGFVTLSTEWHEFRLDVSGADLSYVLGGFGWVTSTAENGGDGAIFYLDEIRYDKARLNDPRFIVSFETERTDNDFDVVMRNVAFTYDNAVALIAFLAAGNVTHARLIADALVYAQDHDRFYDDGRIRNAYQGGDLMLPPGWTPNGRVDSVRMPGWYDATEQEWLEDKFQVSTHTGNVAWAMLGLLAYYESEGGAEYLDAARQMGEWVESNCRDARGSGGYTGGFEGWEPTPEKLEYKSTEHNIDLYAAFLRLGAATAEEEWRERAEHARGFLLSMWDEEEGKFWTGTATDGVTVNEEVIPVDAQAWAVLALGDEGSAYWRALDYAESNLATAGGFDFNEDLDGVWYEGTSQMASAYSEVGQSSRAQSLVDFVKSAEYDSGAVPAASIDGLTTGFDLPNGDPWLYFRRAHVGATSWLILADQGVNPFRPDWQ